MENTKKLVLVSPDYIDRLKTAQGPSPERRKVQELEDQLSTLLGDTTIDNTSKMKRYADILQRYQVYDTKANEPTTVRLLPTNAESHMEERQSKLEKDVIDSVPKVFKSKASQLLKMIGESELGWNEKGELLINDQRVKGSHIIDLVNDVIRKRKSPTPIGMGDFLQSFGSAKYASRIDR